MTEEKQEPQKIDFKLPSVEELVGAGAHFGHRTSRWNPKMKPYIFGVRHAVHIIDADKSLAKLEEAVNFISEIASKGGTILFVGTKPTVKKIIQEGAQNCGMPYVIGRWLGGTLTNFKTIGKRIEYFRNLETQIAQDELQKYTKKERLAFQKELESLKTNLEGIKNLTRLPEAIFVADIKEDNLVVREARRVGISVVGICDTNTDPTLVDYPIPANDDASSSVRIILDAIVGAIKQAKEI
ncbi:MAG: 30S ribosomal protein S2 [Candidatus Portnoybacteria bacterium]|nr:30S ribosomal protein S2 [Candidatus Portnoybacteria bacterium]